MFNLYDTNQNGTIEYDEFCSRLMQKDQPAPMLMDRLRRKLNSRGARGILGISRQFRIFDDSGNRQLDLYEFTKAMSDYAMGFTKDELHTLFAEFDRDHSGHIDYDEFLRTVRGPLNANRQKHVDKAFGLMDRNKSGKIDINDLYGVYDASRHPDVLNGKKTEK